MLKDKVIIVTGGAMGMGEASAKKFADYGAKVVIADFNEEEGQKVTDEINENGGQATFVKTDVSSEEDCENMVKHAVETYGRLDGALNNAAVSPDQNKVHEMDMDYYDKLMSVDLKGVVLCMKYELQQFLEQGDGGAIINTSSVSGLRPQPDNPAYCIAKYGVIGATEQAAMDYGEHNIRINTVAPGAINTPMLQQALIDFNLDPDGYAKQLSVLGRFAESDEVAEANAWLLSDKASYVTGATLAVDGGYTSM